MSERHIDLVRNDWCAGVQHRYGWILEGMARDDLLPSLDGDYVWRTQPHTDDECPFAEAESLRFSATAGR